MPNTAPQVTNINTESTYTLTPKQAAKELGVSLPTLYQMLHKPNGIPHIRPTQKKILIIRSMLETWLTREADKHSAS